MEMTQEFVECLKWSAAAFVCGICLREWCRQSIGQWIGRANVAVALFVMSAFGLHSVRECSTLIQLVEHKNANSIASAASVVDVKVETKGGTVISWGRDRPVSVATGRGGRGGTRGRFGDSYPATAHHGSDDLPHAKHADDGIKITGRDF
jgi:hypothetical protein